MNASVVMYGPSGCGKTRDSQKIADALGLRTVVDGWHARPADFFPQGYLYITNYISPEDTQTIWEQHPGSTVVSYFDATIQKLLR